MASRFRQPISIISNTIEATPPDYLIDQMAELLEMPRDVLYFYVRRLPNDMGPKDGVDQERIVAAYEALRGELNGSKPDSL